MVHRRVVHARVIHGIVIHGSLIFSRFSGGRSRRLGRLVLVLVHAVHRLGMGGEGKGERRRSGKGPAKHLFCFSVRVQGTYIPPMRVVIQIAMATIITFSVRETKPSGTFEEPPTQAHLSSRRSM